ncbi:MAG: hypothetical protein ACYDAY_10505 [Candidatus Dormibacteria bacterium]
MHVFPNSVYPFIVCCGITLLMFGFVFFQSLPGRLLLTLGIFALLGGVAGWMLEDTDLYSGSADGH